MAPGLDYGDPGVPGGDLTGIYYMKNIREAMEWDKTLDSVTSAVVLEAGPLGLEMVTALRHRGIETHLVDPAPWALSMATDPDIVKPVEDSWVEMGVKPALQHQARRDPRRRRRPRPRGRDLRRRDRLPTWSSCAPTRSPTPAGGRGRADGRLRRRVHRRRAHGDLRAGCVGRRRLHRGAPRGLDVPIQGLSGSHAYGQGKVAGINAAGGARAYQPVYVPWGMVPASG